MKILTPLNGRKAPSLVPEFFLTLNMLTPAQMRPGNRPIIVGAPTSHSLSRGGPIDEQLSWNHVQNISFALLNRYCKLTH